MEPEIAHYNVPILNILTSQVNAAIKLAKTEKDEGRDNV